LVHRIQSRESIFIHRLDSTALLWVAWKIIHRNAREIVCSVSCSVAIIARLAVKRHEISTAAIASTCINASGRIIAIACRRSADYSVRFTHVVILKIGLEIWRELTSVGSIVLLSNKIWIHTAVIVVVAHCSCIHYCLSSIVSDPIHIMYLVMI